MKQARMVKPGDPAKNFSLKDQNDKTFGLSEQAGKHTLLSFHPLAWTDFCAAQMKSLEDYQELLASLNCIPVGKVSTQGHARGHGQRAFRLNTLRCCVISGRMESLHRNTGSFEKKTVFPSGQM